MTRFVNIRPNGGKVTRWDENLRGAFSFRVIMLRPVVFLIRLPKNTKTKTVFLYWSRKSKGGEGKSKHSPPNISDEKALFSFVFASCTYNSPIKQRKCLFSLGVSEIDYLTMSRHPNVQRLPLLNQIRPCIRTVKDSRTQIALISDRFHTCLVFKVLMQNTIQGKKEIGGWLWKACGASF